MPIQPGRNLGVIIPPELARDEWIAGQNSQIAFAERVPGGSWASWLPVFEKQSDSLADMMNCVSESACHSIEMQLQFLLDSGLLPQSVQLELDNLGYLNIERRVDLSERFLSKVSATTRQGNTLIRVWDSFRQFWALPESDRPALS